ncbi:MAG: DNA-3-methyladenine glycosylase [Defluviitaleaceae bacterium]|nr:DNA-3-methyladenine glycosylase [Defluviitaleaceae bacterium]
MIDFINGSTIENAKKLLGKKLLIKRLNKWIGGYIVEVEAYLGIQDEAAHSYKGKRTPKIEAMYQSGGTIYVYTMHGHNMLNIVMRPKDVPEGVLIRGLQPTDGIELMQLYRQVEKFNLTNGPGKLTKALDITREFNGKTLNTDIIRLDELNSLIPKKICVSPRIGIPNKGKWTNEPLRFYVDGNPYVSTLPKKQMKDTHTTWKY